MNLTVEEIKKMLEGITPGPWEWWNGCSWWRLGTENQSNPPVLEPIKDSDGHPNLTIRNYRDREFIAKSPEIVASLLARVEELELKIEAARNVAIRHRSESRWGGQPIVEIDCDIERELKRLGGKSE